MADEDFEYQLQQQLSSSGQDHPERKNGTEFVDTDGTKYEWNSEKRAWFPKIDETFIAMYQASYGVDEGTSREPTDAATEQSKDNPPKVSVSNMNSKMKGDVNKRKRPYHGWFDLDEERNTNVYVNGLPLDISEEEFYQLMSKYGIIKEGEDGSPKLKLYRDTNGEIKGDGRCCYLKVESVDLAIQLLNDSDYKGCKIYVEKANFKMKGNYNPELKKSKQIQGKGKGKQNKLLGWKEDGGPKRSKQERIVILENMFSPEEFENHPESIQDIRDDIREECEKFGDIKKIIVFDRNEKGVVSVAFKAIESADICIEKMQGRFFGGRKLNAHSWDGVTDYEVTETEEQKQERLKKWQEFIEKPD